MQLTEGFPHYVALDKMASRLEVYTLQRIAPIPNVGCYFEAFRPTNVTLMTRLEMLVASFSAFVADVISLSWNLSSSVLLYSLLIQA